MKILVIPDVHLKPWIFDKADKIISDRSDIEMAVSLGDLPDDWKCKNKSGLYDDTFDAAERFLTRYPGTVWIKGNHECSYIYNEWQNKKAYHAEKTAITRINEFYKKTTEKGSAPVFAWQNGRVIFSHAGIVQAFIDGIRKYTPDAAADWTDTGQIIKMVNGLSKDDMWGYASPIWARPQAAFRFEETQEMSGTPGKTIQVVGHTPVKDITEETDPAGIKLISCDTFSLDHNRKPMGSGKFLIIDTETGKWEALNGRE